MICVSQIEIYVHVYSQGPVTPCAQVYDEVAQQIVIHIEYVFNAHNNPNIRT